MENHTQIAAKIILDLFTQQIGRADKVIDGFTDEQLDKEVAPGRNSGIYLLGHLVSVHEAMLCCRY
jgi:hypothetical protein